MSFITNFHCKKIDAQVRDREMCTDPDHQNMISRVVRNSYIKQLLQKYLYRIQIIKPCTIKNKRMINNISLIFYFFI